MQKQKAIKKPGFYNVGDTLYLRVGFTGSKSWIQRLTIDGKRRDIGLGSFKLVTLAEAREMAFENRTDGIPVSVRRRPFLVLGQLIGNFVPGRL